MNTTMMESVLIEPSAFSASQINEFMQTILNDLSMDIDKINQFRGVISPEKNPQVYIWLLEALIANKVLAFNQLSS
jgi:hypothetical protein